MPFGPGLEGLVSLTMSGSKVSGTLPNGNKTDVDHIWTANKISQIFLDHAHISGVLPETLPSSLNFIAMPDTKVSGSIPAL